MMAQALSHLRVLDLTHYVAGPYCTKLLAGFGAEVIKIERPGTGDGLRSIGPFYRNEPHPDCSIPFLWLNTGKKSITLNLQHETGKQLFSALVRGVDLVIENFSPRVMPALGLDYNALRSISPRLIMTSISNFGQTGPYRDHRAEEIVEYALSGLMYLTGDLAQPPLASGPAIAQYTGGMAAYIATLMACYHRTVSGRGQYVDVSIHEACLDNIEIALVEYLHHGVIARRRDDRHTLVPWELYPCQDGYAAIIGGPVRRWLPAADLFEEPRLLDKQYQHMADRMARRDEVEALVREWATKHKKKDIYHTGQAHRLAFGFLASLEEVFDAPQHKARGYFVEIDHPIVGKHKYCGAPFKLSETPWKSMRTPLLGEHNEEIYRGLLGYAPQDLQRLRQEGII